MVHDWRRSGPIGNDSHFGQFGLQILATLGQVTFDDGVHVGRPARGLTLHGTRAGVPQLVLGNTADVEQGGQLPKVAPLVTVIAGLLEHTTGYVLDLCCRYFSLVHVLSMDHFFGSILSK